MVSDAIPAASAIPAAIDGILAALRDAPGLAGVQIIDGPTTADVPGDVIAIGLAPDDLEINARHTVAGLLTGQQEFDVMCLARSWSGSTNLKPRRDRAFALVSAVQAALDTDRSLGEAVTQARISSVIYIPAQIASQGALVTVVFHIQIDAFNASP